MTSTADPTMTLPCDDHIDGLLGRPLSLLMKRRRRQVLEQRLLQHEENALKKYADVDAKLASDPRLKVLNSTSS